MFKIGITGGIGSGKSTIAKLLSDFGSIPIIDADKIAREIVQPGERTLKKIEMSFEDILLSDGNLNRSKLASIIFNDDVQRNKLNTIMFPVIQDEVMQRFDQYEEMGEKYVIYDAPLLFESAGHSLVDYIVMVYVPQSIQMRRVQRRNNLTDDDTKARVASQPHIDELLKRPHDFLVRNTVSFNGTRSIVAALWADIRQKNEGLPPSLSRLE